MVAPGDVFGHYQILEVLGRGGMGEVFLARDQLLDRKVALKFLSVSAEHEPSIRQRFPLEAKANFDRVPGAIRRNDVDDFAGVESLDANAGTDVDFGGSAVLLDAGNGRQLLVAGQKSAVVHGFDPDQNGKLSRLDLERQLSRCRSGGADFFPVVRQQRHGHAGGRGFDQRNRR